MEAAIEHVLGVAAKGRMNETNTRVLLIEPVLDALGWNIRDLACVTREHKVYDGSFLDYALLADLKPVLFLEAKALGSDLLDPKFTAQTVNYANNEGVVWCVLSDGVKYRVYKTNEPVDMSRKLVFELDLTDFEDEQERPILLRRLHMLSREAIEAGELDALGLRLFDDARVRAVLERLFYDPPSRFLSLLRASLEDGRQLSPSNIRDSLARVGRSLLGSSATVVPTPETTPRTGGRGETTQSLRRGERSYTYEDHFGDKPQVITDLYSRLHEAVVGLGEDVERVFRKQYVGYRIGKKTFISVIPQKGRLRLVLPLNPDTYTGQPGMRSLRNVGHWGVGDLEVTLESEDKVASVLELARIAADAARQ
jgi:predicted transport protein